MSVRFKFRSSVDFDSVDIEGRPSISVRDLKLNIIHRKNLNICQDFDLLFSDALTGQEFHDENFQIPSGFSVIIKRVPAGSLPLVMARVGSPENFKTKDNSAVKNLIPVNVETIDFDDFGDELCPVPEGTIYDSNLDVDKKSSEKTVNAVARCVEPPSGGCQKLEASPAHSGVEESTPARQPKLVVEETMKMERVVDVNLSTLQDANFPSELKCTLCNSLFKEAIMIPCCQHSFCDKCIHLALVKQGRCPRCLSTKCSAIDLLPNVSLRQAIDRFLESHILSNSSENAFHRYAPDGESGIQVKEVSGAGSTVRREQEIPHSPSATGKGSNQIVEEATFDPMSRNHVALGGQPMQDEAESSVKRRRTTLLVGNADVDKGFKRTGRNEKGDRTCYMCGSPDHLIRDCPTAPRPHPMFQSGNAMFQGAMSGYVPPPYWSGNSFNHIRQFPNIYGSRGLVPFNATVVTANPFNVPMHVPSMLGRLPSYGGFMRTGGIVTPPGIGAECHLSHSGFSDIQDCEKRQKLSNEFIRRCHYNKPERSHEHKYHLDRQKSVSYSEDSLTRRPTRKHRLDDHLDDDIYFVGERCEKSSQSSAAGRDRRSYHRSGRSSPEVEDMPSTSSYHGKERHQCHHRRSEKHKERREHRGSDSSGNHHPTSRERDHRRKGSNYDVERQIQKQHSYSESDSKPKFYGDREKQAIERDSKLGSRHSRHDAEAMNDELSHDRWQMGSGSREYGGKGYHFHKWKRV